MSALELRGETLGIEFRRGRTFTPHTLLALQAAAFAEAHGTIEQVFDYHRALFKAYFTDHEDLMDVEVLVRHAAAAGLDADALRRALADGTYRDEVQREIEEAREIGVTAIPTFILNDEYAIVGAQTRDVIERVFEQLGGRRREA